MSPPASSRRLGLLLCAAAAVVAVVLLVLTAVLGLGQLWWIFTALSLPVTGSVAAVLLYRRARVGGAGLVRSGLLGAAAPAVGLAVCAVALALPSALRVHENGRLVAWSAPGESSVVLAEHGVALTTEEDGEDEDAPDSIVVGRDLDDGRVRWRTRLRVPEDARRGSYEARWQRVGDVAIVAGGPFRYAALDLRTGRVLWQDTRPGLRISAIATTRAVASTHCVPEDDEDDDEEGGRNSGVTQPCVAEVRDLRTGKVRWRTRIAPQGVYLGAPTGALTETSGPLWPGRWVLTFAPDPRAPDAVPEWDTPSPGLDRPLAWAVRDLETGAVVRRGTTRGLSGLALAGGGLLRQRTVERSARSFRPRTTWSLVDPATGRVRWSRTQAAGRPDPGGPGTGIWLASGRVPVARAPFADYSVNLENEFAPGGGQRLRLLDPRTGRLSAIPVGAALYLSFVDQPAPPVTAATVARNPDPDAHALVSVSGRTAFTGRMLLASPGRPGASVAWPDDADGGDYEATSTLAARSRGRSLEDMTGEEQADGVEVRDVRTGEVVNRLRGYGIGDVSAVGERLVVDDRSEDEDGEGVTRVLVREP